MLDDADPEIVSDALIYLMNYGDASAKDPVWQRYVQWSDRWKGREAVLMARTAGTAGNWQQLGLGENLARTLMAGHGWIADGALIEQVLQRCIGRAMCEQLRQTAPEAPKQPYMITPYSAGNSGSIQVAQYQEMSLELFEQKIKQFPRGTKFTMAARQMPTADQRALEEQVCDILEKNGLLLMPAPPVPVAGPN